MRDLTAWHKGKSMNQSFKAIQVDLTCLRPCRTVGTDTEQDIVEIVTLKSITDLTGFPCNSSKSHHHGSRKSVSFPLGDGSTELAAPNSVIHSGALFHYASIPRDGGVGGGGSGVVTTSNGPLAVVSCIQTTSDNKGGANHETFVSNPNVRSLPSGRSSSVSDYAYSREADMTANHYGKTPLFSNKTTTAPKLNYPHTFSKLYSLGSAQKTPQKNPGPDISLGFVDTAEEPLLTAGQSSPTYWRFYNNTHSTDRNFVRSSQPNDFLKMSTPTHDTFRRAAPEGKVTTPNKKTTMTIGDPAVLQCQCSIPSTVVSTTVSSSRPMLHEQALYPLTMSTNTTLL